MRVINGNNNYAVFNDDNNNLISINFVKIGTAIVTNHDDIMTNKVEEKSDYEVLQYVSTSNLNIKIADLPDIGEKVEEHQFYNWNGKVILCRQSHERTIYPPDQTPALFSIYRTNEDSLEWIPGEEVLIGWIRKYNNVKYECIQAHMTVEGQTPDLVPALWNLYNDPNLIDIWVQPTGASDAYNIGDKVHFPTISDPVYESVINANVWSPTVYPTGWRLV